MCQNHSRKSWGSRRPSKVEHPTWCFSNIGHQSLAHFASNMISTDHVLLHAHCGLGQVLFMFITVFKTRLYFTQSLIDRC